MNEMPPEWRRCFTRGNDALQRENYDYAIDLFNQVLDADPSFFEARKALRQAQQGKAGKGGGFFRKMMSGAGNTPAILKGQAALRTNPASALSIAETILNTDPGSTQGHNIVVEAALALEMPHTAAMSLEVLNRNSPNDGEIAVLYGRALAEIGEAGKGEQVLSAYMRGNPLDQDAGQALKDIAAKRSMKEGGYDAAATGKASYRDMLKDKQEAESLEQQNKVQTSEDNTERLIREYEARLKAEPANARLMRSLGELYTQRKEFDKALAALEKMKGTELGGDASVDQAIVNTVVKRYEHQIEQLDQQDADYAQHVARINAEKLAFQVAESEKRAQKFPTDLVIRFEMGQLYFQAGKISEAIQELQKAQANPNKRLPALNLLAQCFAKRRMYDLAARTLQNAIKEKAVLDEEKKELVYNLGSVLESMGKKEDAIEQFKIIYETDIGYRDVAAKVDAYYASQ